jgi:hypothetical protein
MLLAPSVGCLTLTPIGPLAGQFQKPAAPKTGPGSEGTAGAPVVTLPQDAPGGPIIQEAPPPPRPAFFVSPDEINAANADEMARKLAGEMEQDRRDAKKITPGAEISFVGRGQQ